MRNWRKYIALFFVLILVGFAFNTAEAQNGGELNFLDDVVVTGDFLKFYRSAPDPQLLFGNAISNVLDMNGTPVQYFDRARLELKENDKGLLQVQLAPLGYFFYKETNTTPVEELFPSSTCRYFPVTGHRVCYDFLRFYDTNNGSVYFGNPLSEMVYENGQIVQYFENARFVYRHNMPGDMKVGLTDIGRLAMIRNLGTAPKPIISEIPGASLDIFAIQARAYVSRALVAPGSPNTLYVVVHLPDFKGVKNAKVNVSMLNGDKVIGQAAAVTDADGIAKIEIDGFDLAPRQTVQLQVVVSYAEQTNKTSTWYRVWY
jgi:hypothetical protein